MTHYRLPGLWKISQAAIQLIMLAVLPFAILAEAREVKSFRKFSEHNPLSFQRINAIAEDKDGFMWFGSQDGLHRFDGYNFKNYHHNETDQSSIGSGHITAILVDEQSRIWAASRGGGLSLLKQGADKFERFNSQSGDLALTDDMISSLLEDSNGNLWVATPDGINLIQLQEQQWQVKHLRHEPGNARSLSHNNVQSLIELANGEIWAGTNGGGINVFDLNGKFIRFFVPGNNGQVFADSHLISALYTDREGNVWIGTFSSGLIRYDHLSSEFTQFTASPANPNSLSSNTIEIINQDSSGRIWAGTDKGLSVYDKKSGQFKRFNHRLSDPNSLGNDFVTALFEDSNRIMWIGTFSGVNYFDPNTTNFLAYNSTLYPQLKNNHISSFTQSDENTLLVSSYTGGIYQLDLRQDQFSVPQYASTFDDKAITKLYSDGDLLWVGTRASGLYRINRNDNSITHYHHDPKNPYSISANSITDIVRDQNDNLWVSTYHASFNRLNQDGRFTRFLPSAPIDDNGPSTNHIIQMVPDEQGYLWLATYGGGINRFDPVARKFTHLSSENGKNDSLSSNIAWIMFLDDSQNLWVGTQSAGLNMLSRENRLDGQYNFKRLTIKDGMNTNTVYAISQDSRGDIWMSHNKGFSRYSPKTKSFNHFNTTHGLLDMEYNQAVVYRDSNKTIYFGSPRGFNSVNHESLLDSRPAPAIQLTNILKLNEPMVFDQALSQIDKLEFGYDDQIISFEYVGFNYVDPNSTRYRYRLQGFDDHWIDAGKLKRATYTNLPAGSYTFEVIAGNNDNVWSDPGLSLDITIHPAPWNTWWAYLLYALMTALILLAYSRQVNRKLIIEQQQKVSLAQQVEEKTQEFQQKNIELEQANKQLENAATTDKVTGVKSRRYLDIYIEQASRLMAQIHENILPVQRSVLPRLYLLMVRVRDFQQVTNSQLVNLTDLLLYSRNPDDLVIRWSEDTFAVIGYEKEHNARELANRLKDRFDPIFEGATAVDMAYSFYPFNFEQPMALSWDQVSVLTEAGLKQVSLSDELKWIGMHGPKEQPFNYLEALKIKTLQELAHLVDIRQA